MPVKNKPIENKTVYKVAAFYETAWDAYGGVRVFDTEAKARAERDAILRNGFSKPVHIWSVTTKLIQE